MTTSTNLPRRAWGGVESWGHAQHQQTPRVLLVWVLKAADRQMPESCINFAFTGQSDRCVIHVCPPLSQMQHDHPTLYQHSRHADAAICVPEDPYGCSLCACWDMHAPTCTLAAPIWRLLEIAAVRITSPECKVPQSRRISTKELSPVHREAYKTPITPLTTNINASHDVQATFA